MSERTVAGLILLAPTLYAFFFVRLYLQGDEIYAPRFGRTLARKDGPKRFWLVVGITALLGLFTLSLSLLAFLS